MKLLQHILSSIKFNGNFCVVGIDGPTASGKTTLADALYDELLKNNIPCLIYRLDWTLSDRNKRLSDLYIIIKKNQSFEYEADLHMNLSKAADFLKIVENNRYEAFVENEIILTDLYNRHDDGNCSGLHKFTLKKQMVIIVEGHYTHHHLLRNYFDLNYMLVANSEELLKRKKLRLADYRDPETVTNYFNLVDLPSFMHYYLKNKAFIENVVLNENFDEQKLITLKDLETILYHSTEKNSTPGAIIFPCCTINYDEYCTQLNLLFNGLSSLHKKLLYLWGIHPLFREQSFIEQINQHFESDNILINYCCINSKNSNEFFYEFGMEFCDIHFVVIGSLVCVKVLAITNYTNRLFVLNFESDGCTSEKGFELYPQNLFESDKPVIIVPNRFFIPGYFKDEQKYCHFFYKKEHNFWNHIVNIFSSQTFIVLKIKSQSQSVFYQKILEDSGFQTFHSMAYIFAINMKGRKNSKIFNELKKTYTNFPVFNYDEINQEEIGNLLSSGIILTDEQLIIPDEIDSKQLIDFYKKADSKIRNKLTRSLVFQYPDFLIAPHVSLTDYVNNLPVSLNEFYFALSVSESGAVPFLTVYSTAGQSIDIQTYFDFFLSKAKPFGIQASMNALGTNGKKNQGYLQMDGPTSFSEIIRTNLICFLEKHADKQLPLWGVGIDHAASFYDNNIKAIKFIEEAVASDWISSFCIDTSNLYSFGINDNAFDKTSDFLEEVIKLLSGKDKDLEFYVGNESLFNKIEESEAIEIYKKLASLFHRIALNSPQQGCFLLGPFLGTLHHQSHDKLKHELSEMIFKACSDSGFAGNVLHGTSFTSFQEIEKLVKKRCLRINYAGKFLEAMVGAFPENIQLKFGVSQDEQKRNFAPLINEIIVDSQDSIRTKLNDILNKVEDCSDQNAMDNEEIDWFRSDHICLPNEDFKQIINTIFNKVKKPEPNEKINKAVFLASMIEVPLKDFTGGLVERIVCAGITNFHIDFGDGELISRNLDGFEKLKYLSKNFPQINTHIHLMIKNPFTKTNGVSFVSKVSDIKKSIIYIHHEAYEQISSWKQGAEAICNEGSIPGIVFTVDEKTEMEQLLFGIKQAGIHNVLMMGVPIGRGGQIFHTAVLKKVETIKAWSQSNNYEIIIEVDGGLSDAVIPACINAGASFLSGWSMFLKYGIENIEKRIEEFIHG